MDDVKATTIIIIIAILTIATIMISLSALDKYQERVMVEKGMCYQVVQGTLVSPKYQYQPCKREQ